MTRKYNAKIKMIARNPITRKFEEVYPEDEVPMSSMIPMFMGSDQKYYTVPDYPIEIAYNDWVAQKLH